MTEHPLDLAARTIDTGRVDAPVNRVTNELSELADGVALIESFSHSLVLDAGDSLVVFDASGPAAGPAVVESLRAWSDKPVDSLVYTHGHIDHVGGSRAFAADAETNGRPTPTVVGHQRILPRFDRYERTSGYNRAINLRQFGGAATVAMTTDDRPFLPRGTLRPDAIYDDRLDRRVGGLAFEHHHCLGETDDHTWTWVPEHRLIAAGDQFIWNFPNCGNPQKVQRYPLEWAESLRAMAAKDPELFVPAHGLPIAGRDRIVGCLETVATTLEDLVERVLDAMNTGAALDDIVHSVTVAPEVLALPYLRPLYDEPEFVVRNIWRLFGGWWDGNPARLKPPSDVSVGIEVAALAGGVDQLVARAEAVAGEGDLRLACQLIEWAVAAAPDSATAHQARHRLYETRRSEETSLMAKGIYRSAGADSQTALTGEAPEVRMRLDLLSDT